ncbi:hypothetical protein VTK73DRAFT_963 [Phialemonium thermophilum]|uniref:Uncharacterized protein n=1 Tax=Phialemonium thermophilum TaxID=223376 RepID=A0ABR3VU49_9PEZI
MRAPESIPVSSPVAFQYSLPVFTPPVFSRLRPPSSLWSPSLPVFIPSLHPQSSSPAFIPSLHSTPLGTLV